MEKPVKIFKKYLCRRKTKILLFLLLFMSIGIFIYTSYNVNLYESIPVVASTQDNQESTITKKQYSWFCVTKDAMTVIVSVLGINLLLSLCIEKEAKNSTLQEIFTEEILSSEKFYDLFDSNEKSKIISAVESNYYGGKNPSYLEMRQSINEKLLEYNNTNENYIVKKCEFSIDCSVYEDYIEKSVVKKIKVCPSKGKKINNFSILKVTSEEIKNKNAVELKYIKVNGDTLSSKDYCMVKDDNRSEADKRLGYNKSSIIKLNESLKFESPTKEKTIEIKYITRVPISDLSYVCRMKMPCESFSLDFEIINSDCYKVNAYAFGFIDDGKNSVNQDNKKNKIKITFDDWIFPGDGVAIALQKINN